MIYIYIYILTTLFLIKIKKKKNPHINIKLWSVNRFYPLSIDLGPTHVGCQRNREANLDSLDLDGHFEG